MYVSVTGQFKYFSDAVLLLQQQTSIFRVIVMIWKRFNEKIKLENKININTYNS